MSMFLNEIHKPQILCRAPGTDSHLGLITAGGSASAHFSLCQIKQLMFERNIYIETEIEVEPPPRSLVCLLSPYMGDSFITYLHPIYKGLVERDRHEHDILTRKILHHVEYIGCGIYHLFTHIHMSICAIMCKWMVDTIPGGIYWV